MHVLRALADDLESPLVERVRCRLKRDDPLKRNPPRLVELDASARYIGGLGLPGSPSRGCGCCCRDGGVGADVVHDHAVVRVERDILHSSKETAARLCGLRSRLYLRLGARHVRLIKLLAWHDSTTDFTRLHVKNDF